VDQNYNFLSSKQATLNSTFLEESWLFTTKDLTEASAEDPVAHTPPKGICYMIHAS